MKKTNPKVSLVIRTKNEEKFIGKVLNLVFKQTFRDFEIIIVDSGSTDGTLEVVKKFPVRLVEIKPDEFNYSYALNVGIKKARGSHVCIISGHSIPMSDTWLEDGLKPFEDEKIAAISGYSSVFLLGYFNRPLGSLPFLFSRPKQNRTPWMTNTNAIIRKDLWKKYPFDENLKGSEDYDWAKEMLSRGYNVVKYRKFSVFHSHLLLGRPGNLEMRPTWKKWNAVIDKKKRPGISYSKLKLN